MGRGVDGEEGGREEWLNGRVDGKVYRWVSE